MKITRSRIAEVIILEPRVFEDERGYFFESYNRKAIRAEAGVSMDFVQDNHSFSKKGVLRGLHYQIQMTQGKLIRVVAGEIYDVAVDIRKSSSTFGQWVGFTLSADSKRAVWIPPGFAHGFLVLSEFAVVIYKTTDYYAPEYERCIIWDDPDLAIEWPIRDAPLLSDKDRQGRALRIAEVFD